MKKIYLDNAATTPLDQEVFEFIKPYFFNTFGNPSSAHSAGREVRKSVEQARAKIADLLHTDPARIIFTSGGTEADNIAIRSAISASGIKVAITSPFEHHAVLNTLKSLEKSGDITLHILMADDKGNLSLQHLENILAFNERALVSVMHGNNEIGNLNDIEAIGGLCRKYDALFHTDTVQTMGHFVYDTTRLPADFLVGSAHKFNGPKGVGFLYFGERTEVRPLISGGSQEKGLRGGTENVTGILGLAKALEISYRDLESDRNHISALKTYMIERLKADIPGVSFNGNSADPDKSNYTVLSVSLPAIESLAPALMYLDSRGICASGGSACTSQNGKGSHVLKAINYDFRRTVIRFSFGKYNTLEEIDTTLNILKEYFENALKQEAMFA